MKILLRLIIALSLMFLTSVTSSAWDPFSNNTNSDNPYTGQWYNLDAWLDEVKGTVDWIETNRFFSEYIQDVVVYLLGFVTIIAIIYMIYWGIIMMTSAWDEEKVKKTKSIITYVIIWICVIWLAYSIVAWLFDVFTNA